MEPNGGPSAASVEAPRGFYPARVDEKGRLKLPADFLGWIRALGEQKLFVTTLDISTVRIYPTSVWKQNEKFFEDAEDADLAERVNFIASHYGADSEIDGQGRILVPTELRRELGIENAQVFLNHHRGRINVFGKEEYDRRMQEAKANLADSLRALEKRGLR